ncbi:MAG: S-layer homology domain-containing protein, partial [Clostridia bacterium]|nr:S-layer homology domain-containing protein [Clostridia bacterium]
MKKKILSLIMTLIICTALVPPTNAFSFEFTHRVTSDTDEHWAEDSINELNLLGIMNGYNGYTNPDNIITRGEFTALIARAFDLKPSDNVQHFSDIAPHHIFFENINAAHASGIIDGFPDGTFRSDNMITREEIILIISRLTEDTSDASKADFKDIKSDYRYMAQLSKVTSDKIVNGYPDGTFRPYEKTTRAESATIIMNAMKKYIEPDTATDMNAFATKYLTEHFANIHTMSGGMAKKDSEYISYAYQKAAELGFSLSNSVSDIVVTESVQDGPFTFLKAVYNVTRLINGAPKTYFGQSEIKAISQNGNTIVYDHRTRIIKQT